MRLDPALCRMPDGRWSCVREGVTEPCGDCDGCRLIAAERRALETGGQRKEQIVAKDEMAVARDDNYRINGTPAWRDDELTNLLNVEPDHDVLALQEWRRRAAPQMTWLWEEVARLNRRLSAVVEAAYGRDREDG